MPTIGSDNFATATELPYGSTSDPTPTAALTTEVDEPDYYGVGSNLRSAWWKFTAPATETVGLDLFSSIISGDPDDADPFVIVWTGTDLASLTYVADGDDNDWRDVHHWLTEFEFDATSGTTYYIQACLYDYSDDIEYVVRMGKRITTIGDWVQEPDHVVTYDLDDSEAWSTHSASAWSAGGVESGIASGSAAAEVNTLLQSGLATLDAFTTGITGVAPATYRVAVGGMVRDGTGTCQASGNTSALFEVFIPSSAPTDYTPTVPADPDASDFEYEGFGSELQSAVLETWDATWGVYYQWGPGPTPTVEHPDFAGTVEYSVLTGSIDPSDRSTWDLSHKAVFEEWGFTSDGEHQSGTEYDITSGIQPGCAFVIMRLPTAIGEFPNAHVPLSSGDGNTTLHAEALNRGTAFPTPFDPPATGGTTVRFTVTPTRYRYIFRDIEELPPATPSISGGITPQRTRFVRPRRS